MTLTRSDKTIGSDSKHGPPALLPGGGFREGGWESRLPKARVNGLSPSLPPPLSVRPSPPPPPFLRANWVIPASKPGRQHPPGVRVVDHPRRGLRRSRPAGPRRGAGGAPHGPPRLRRPRGRHAAPPRTAAASGPPAPGGAAARASDGPPPHPAGRRRNAARGAPPGSPGDMRGERFDSAAPHGRCPKPAAPRGDQSRTQATAGLTRAAAAICLESARATSARAGRRGGVARTRAPASARTHARSESP